MPEPTLTDPEWRAVIEARLGHLERHAGIDRDRQAEDRAAAVVRATMPPLLPAPLPFEPRPRAVKGGPACPATMDARFDALLIELGGDAPATPPTPAEAGE